MCVLFSNSFSGDMHERMKMPRENNERMTGRFCGGVPRVMLVVIRKSPDSWRGQ